MKKCNLIKLFLIFITFSTVFSNFLAVGYSNEVALFDGMYVKHQYRYVGLSEVFPTTLTWNESSDDIFHVEWKVGGSIDATGSWDVNVTTRIVSNMRNFGPDNGSHDFCWIHTNVSLNDQFALFNFFKNDDTIYNITGESMLDSMAVWILKDDYGGVFWFEKTKGFLLNGTSRYNNNWQNYRFVETNAVKDKGGIPGYSHFLLIGIIIGISILIMRKRKR